MLVKLTVDAGGLVLLIEDNGRGIPPGKLGSLGLLGMQERAGSLGGRLTIADRKPGTSVTASVRTLKRILDFKINTPYNR